MPSSGLPHALEGSLHEAPSDALFWIAAGLTLTLGLLLQRAPAESNRWKFVLQRFTHWEEHSESVVDSQFSIGRGHEFARTYHPRRRVHSASPTGLSRALVWPFPSAFDCSQHATYRPHPLWSHMGTVKKPLEPLGQRFSLLPALWIALPFFLWVLVSAQASQDLMEPFYVGIVILSLILYALGLLKALFRYVSTGHTPWYVAILYLCALETSPLFWVIFFQTYEG